MSDKPTPFKVYKPPVLNKAELQEKCDALTLENFNLKRERDQLRRERDALHERTVAAESREQEWRGSWERAAQSEKQLWAEVQQLRAAQEAAGNEAK